MKILLIGGSGFIGPHVVRELARHGHEIIVFHRGHAQAMGTGVKQIHGNRNEMRLAGVDRAVMSRTLLRPSHLRLRRNVR